MDIEDLRFTSEHKQKPELTEEQTSRLIQIAKACPVHKILTTHIEINTTLG